MNKIAGVALLLALAATASAQNGGLATPAGAPPPGIASASQQMVVTRAGSQPAAKGPVQYFTGSVRVDPLSARTRPQPQRASP